MYILNNNGPRIDPCGTPYCSDYQGACDGCRIFGIYPPSSPQKIPNVRHPLKSENQGAEIDAGDGNEPYRIPNIWCLHPVFPFKYQVSGASEKNTPQLYSSNNQRKIRKFSLTLNK